VANEIYSQKQKCQQVSANQSQDHAPQCSPHAIAKVLSLLTIPLDFTQSIFSTVAYELLILVYYFIGYKQLFGYGIWGTLWRQVLVSICVILSFMLLIWIFFPTMMDTVMEALDIVGYYTEYIL
jgi:hypothetical protein